MGLALAVATAMLLGRAWNACDVGVNDTANSTFLTWLFIPGLWAVLVLAWVAVGALLGNHPRVHALALAATLLGLAWCAVSILWQGDASPACPDGLPAWWPRLVPAPGF
ncbi:hypothetical protein ACFUIY_23640 [Streptomyces griseorubiginosus]|uniref:hypothetical protein n=1 Tax=Streptomyces griseorubiginosus TaxID=67304 RepID=UPI001140109B|nr:hypothetical protein [Streptomyces griseorubiginosus]